MIAGAGSARLSPDGGPARVAGPAHDVSVLIEGEMASARSWWRARSIGSVRRDRRLAALNCAALTDELKQVDPRVAHSARGADRTV
jgi:hypothetical protein